MSLRTRWRRTIKKFLRWRLSSITRKIITVNANSRLESSLIIETRHANRTRLWSNSLKNKKKKLRIFHLKWRKIKPIRKRLKCLIYNSNELKTAPNNTNDKYNRSCSKKKKSSNSKETIFRRNKRKSIILKKNTKKMWVVWIDRLKMDKKNSLRKLKIITTWKKNLKRECPKMTT